MCKYPTLEKYAYVEDTSTTKADLAIDTLQVLERFINKNRALSPGAKEVDPATTCAKRYGRRSIERLSEGPVPQSNSAARCSAESDDAAERVLGSGPRSAKREITDSEHLNGLKVMSLLYRY